MATNILKKEYRIQFVCIQVENKFESWIEIHNEENTTRELRLWNKKLILNFKKLCINIH